MKNQFVVAKARNLREPLMVLSLILLIASVLFVAYAQAGESQDSKAARGKCPHLQSVQKHKCTHASAAAAPCCDHAGKPDGCSKALKKKLNLTDKQLGEMKRIRAEYREGTKALRDRIHKKREEVNALYRDPEAKNRDIKKLHGKVIELKGKKRERNLAYRLKLRDLFTPEQIGSLPEGSMKCFLGGGDKGGCSKKCSGKGHISKKCSGKCAHSQKSETKGVCPYKGKGASEGTQL